MGCDCNGSGIVIDSEGEYRLCSCLKKKRLQAYLNPLGVTETPTDDRQELLDQIDYRSDLKINGRGLSIAQFNGCLAYLLKDHYPEDYRVENICELYSYMQSQEGGWDEVFKIQDPVLILTAGLPEEHVGITKDGEVWTNNTYGKMAKQIIGYRVRKGFYTWYATMGDDYSAVHDIMRENDFEKISLVDNKNEFRIV